MKKIKIYTQPVFVGIFTTIAFIGVTLFLWYAARLEDETAWALSIIFSAVLSVLLGILSGMVRFHNNNLEMMVEERTLELEKKNKALQVQTEKAQEAARLKDEFVTIMSHELKTPLNAIIGFSDIMLEELQGPLNERQKESLNRLSGSAQDLHVLVSNILDLPKVEMKQMSLNISEYRPNEILGDVEKMLPGLMKEKGVKIIVKKDPHLKKAVGDEVKIRHIVTNLITNAIKFTKSGSITVSSEKDDDHVIFKVEDTGIGIPEDIVPIIFEAFRQGDSSIRRQYGGTGLGLFIVERFVERMQGKLELKSRQNQGTTIKVRLPVEVHA